MNRNLPSRLLPTVFAVAACVSTASRVSGQTSCFLSGPTLATALGPRSVAVGDFNGDGRADFAVANRASDNVSVFLGDGNGGFGPPGTFSVGRGPQSITTADFDGDGDADLAIANGGDLGLANLSDVSILLGTGDGGFAPALDFAIGDPASHPSSIVAADFNRDGRIDIALGNYGLSRVSILAGDGHGSFTLAGTFGPLFQNVFSIAAGDFNGDSNPDVVATLDFIHSVGVLLGTGTGALGSPTLFPAPPLPIGVAVGDFNGDARADLAVANQAGVSILLGNGQGGFGPATTFPAGGGSRAVVIADFDSDGRLDVAAANESGGTVSVLLGDGTGQFGPTANYAVGTFPLALAAGDFDADGLPDLAVANSGSNSVSILINAAPTVLPASVSAGTVNMPYSTQLAASGGTGPYAFALSGALPEGLSLNASTGVLSGIPTQVGTSTFSITVTDATACSSTRAYSVTIARANTVLVVASPTNPAFPGQTIHLTARVNASPAGPVSPTGTVTFFEGLETIGSAPVVSGVATLSVSGLALGTHVFSAVYSGDANFNPSTSPILTQVVAVPEIPTLDAAGLAALTVLLAAAALLLIRPRG